MSKRALASVILAILNGVSGLILFIALYNRDATSWVMQASLAAILLQSMIHIIVTLTFGENEKRHPVSMRNKGGGHGKAI